MFDISTTLLLVPTQLERQRFTGFADWPAYEKHIQLCGFGPIAAAARTARLLEQHNPRHVLLMGIAGSYDAQRVPIGEAVAFENVSCDGIGAGTGKGFVAASELGFPQTSLGEELGGNVVTDELPLLLPIDQPADQRLLTVCSASANLNEVQQRRLRFPRVIAEDMEAFGVALACTAAGVPLTVVRGISNLAGNRDTAHWHVDAAIESAWQVCRRLLE